MNNLCHGACNPSFVTRPSTGIPLGPGVGGVGHNSQPVTRGLTLARRTRSTNEAQGISRIRCELHAHDNHGSNTQTPTYETKESSCRESNSTRGTLLEWKAAEGPLSHYPRNFYSSTPGAQNPYPSLNISTQEQRIYDVVESTLMLTDRIDRKHFLGTGIQPI